MIHVTWPGTTLAYEQANVYARATGYISTRNVDIGSKARAGDVLAIIAAPDLDQQLAQARAQLIQMQASVEQAKATAELGRVTSSRSSKLFTQDSVSKQQADNDRLTYASEKASTAVAEANVVAQQAAVDRLVQLTGFERVVAPFDGTVTARFIDVGAFVQGDDVSGTFLFTMMHSNVIRIQTYVPQDQAFGLTAGVEAVIRVPEIPKRNFPGKVTRVAGALAPGTRTLLTEIDVPNPDGALTPGTYCVVELRIPRKTASLIVPARAIIFNQNGLQAAVVQNDVVHMHKMTITRDFGREVEVSRGSGGWRPSYHQSSRRSPRWRQGADSDAAARGDAIRSWENRAMKSLVALGVALAMVLLGGARATERPPVKVAMFADLSSVYSQTGGAGAIEAARMAIEDFGASGGGPVEFVFADPRNNAELGAAIARKWYAEGVDVIADVPNSAVALAVQQVSREAKKIVLFSSPASDDLTGPNCSPYSVHWTYDTYAMAHGTAQAIMNSGGDSWFFITADYAFGTAMERDAGDVIRSEGGIVLGSVRAPLGTTDFSRYLLQAKTSRAKVVGLAIAGQDMINAIREASEFSVVQDGQRLVGLLVFISDVHSLGLDIAQGLRMTSAYYWDQNDGTRAWARRFFSKTKRMPTMVQGGVYGALTHYLKAVKACGRRRCGSCYGEDARDAHRGFHDP